MLETLAGRFSLLFLCRLSSTWWSNNEKDQSKILSFDSPLLPCTSESLKRQEARRDSVATRPLESNECQKRSREKQWGHHRNQVARGWKSIEILSSPMGGRKNIADTALWHQRHRYESTITLVCNDEDRQAGPMKARKDVGPTTKILASLRQEQGRENSCIPKNERLRQRPFDETLRAESEWMSQIENLFLATFSSSSSSQQNWWQHEHQFTNGEILNGEFADFSRFPCKRRVVWTEHFVARTFFSVLSCRARLSMFNLHTRMRVAQDVNRSCVVPLRTQKSSRLTACFTRHFSVYLTPSHRFVRRLHRRHNFTTADWTGVPPVPLRWKADSLAIRLNHFLTQHTVIVKPFALEPSEKSKSSSHHNWSTS